MTDFMSKKTKGWVAYWRLHVAFIFNKTKKSMLCFAAEAHSLLPIFLESQVIPSYIGTQSPIFCDSLT